MNATVELIDTTLRDGSQTPGVIFSIEQKLRIIELLRDAGIRRFEAGIPASGERECTDFSLFKQHFPELVFIAWCRASCNDIDASIRTACNAIHISFPVSPVHIQIPGFTEEYILSLLSQCIAHARPHCNEISIGAQDASRADARFLCKFIEHAAHCKVNRIRIADTVGILSPSSTSKLIKMCKKAGGQTEIEFHAHNDLGMATANTISAFEAGASSADVTINGLGERAGNAALEEVVMALTVATKFQFSFKTALLSTICSEVAEMTGHPISPIKPITGSNLFCHESGIHTHGLLKNRASYEPYDASLTGHEPTRFIGGVHSGTTGIRHIFNSSNIAIENNELRRFLKYLKDLSISSKKTYSDKELLSLLNEFRNC